MARTMVPEGAQVGIGSWPLSIAMRDFLGSVLDRVGGVAEAHAPFVRFEGDGEERFLTLIVVGANGTVSSHLEERLDQELGGGLPDGMRYRILVQPADGPLMAPVRAAQCQVWPPASSDQLVLERATTVRVGTPASKPDAAWTERLGRALGSIGGIAEAHLPMVQLPGQEPALVLIVVPDNGVPHDRVRQHLAIALKPLLADGQHLDSMVVEPDAPMLGSARKAGMALDLGRPRSRRWAFWKA